MLSDAESSDEALRFMLYTYVVFFFDHLRIMFSLESLVMCWPYFVYRLVSNGSLHILLLWHNVALYDF